MILVETKIKTQLHQEAEADRIKDEAGQPPAPLPAPDKRSGVLRSIIAQFLIGPAAAQAGEAVAR